MVRGYGRFAFELYVITITCDAAAVLSGHCAECLVYLSSLVDFYFVHDVVLIIC